MPQPKTALPVDPAVERQERIDAVMNELRPKLDAMLQKMVETIVDKPEAEELGEVEFVRALYVSGAKMWDGFWHSQQHKAA